MFIAHLLARAIRVEADLLDQLFNSSEKRLARMLLLLANFGKEEKPGRCHVVESLMRVGFHS
jgi:CRP/FNR family transcriptional regulator, cyclic AMP receptor protein